MKTTMVQYAVGNENRAIAWRHLGGATSYLSNVRARNKPPRMLVPRSVAPSLATALRDTLGRVSPSLCCGPAWGEEFVLLGAAFYLALRDLATSAPRARDGRLALARQAEATLFAVSQLPGNERWEQSVSVVRVVGRRRGYLVGNISDNTAGAAIVAHDTYGYPFDGLAAMASVAVLGMWRAGTLGGWITDLDIRRSPIPHYYPAEGLQPRPR